MLWLVIGLLVGAGFVILANRKTNMAWFDWVFLVLAVIFGILAIQNYTASLDELETKAATLLLFAFGLPAVLFAAIVVVRSLRKAPAAKAS